MIAKYIIHIMYLRRFVQLPPTKNNKNKNKNKQGCNDNMSS